jgi:hypothetical protein
MKKPAWTAAILPFRKPTVTKKPDIDMYPIIKVEEYKHGKIDKTYYLVRKPSGDEVMFSSYKEAHAFQQGAK